MNFTIPEKLFREAALCPHDFSCLETRCCGGQPVCPVQRLGSDGELLLKNACRVSCPYWAAAAPAPVCVCPLYRVVHPFLAPPENRHPVRA